MDFDNRKVYGDTFISDGLVGSRYREGLPLRNGGKGEAALLQAENSRLIGS